MKTHLQEQIDRGDRQDRRMALAGIAFCLAFFVGVIALWVQP